MLITRTFPVSGRRGSHVLISAFAVITMGSILHFAWEWSGRNPMVAVFAAVNESTWEHLKLAFWPAIIIALVQRRLYHRPPGWLVATVVRVLMPPILIVLFFYGYIALSGRNYLLLDISTFIVAVFFGEFLGYGIMWTQIGFRTRVGASIVLATAIVAFATLSLRPPGVFLFDEPTQQRHGAAVP